MDLQCGGTPVPSTVLLNPWNNQIWHQPRHLGLPGKLRPGEVGCLVCQEGTDPGPTCLDWLVPGRTTLITAP